MKQLLLAIIGLLIGNVASAETRLLRPEEAFRPSLYQTGPRALALQFQIAPGYYLYRDRININAVQPAPELTATLPGSVRKQDPAFGLVETYPESMAITLSSASDWPAAGQITLKYQGCANIGICFPPQTITLRAGESAASDTSRMDALLGTPQIAARETDLPLSQPRPALFAGHWLATLGLFFLAGLGLAFTACMYPLIPIVSGIVLGGTPKRRCHALGLTFTYVQGMAFSYTIAGIIAAASGAYLAALLQQPWVIAGFSLFFVAMALAMFGVFELQLPSSLQSRFNALANKLPGGRYIPVGIMGALSALIVGPCMAPPLAAALVYLGQTGDLLLGASSLYALALGMGLPLMVIGIFGVTALPRVSARTLAIIRILLGVLLLAMAVWVARPLWQTKHHAAGFEPVATLAELDNALATSQGQPVLLDFYADWCVSCIEFERDTLSQPEVQRQLKAFRLLRADVTANTPEQRALMARYGVFGPPTLLFFDRNGRLQATRVIGFQKAPEFQKVLGSVGI